MKKYKVYIFQLLLIVCCFAKNSSIGQVCYSDEYVEISSVKSLTDTYDVVTMKRAGKRVKAKYFAGRDYNGRSVYQRFLEWNKLNPNTILISSGAYLNSRNIPTGLTIDNGVIVNQNLIRGGMDALVIIYATGGIVASYLDEGNLKVKGLSRSLDIRKSGDLDDFIEWAKENEVTVFQTHLLVFDGQLTIDRKTSSPSPRERRFLVVGKNDVDEIVHTIVYNPAYISLYDGSKKVKEFLNDFMDIEVIFMINLDTGYQDVFQLYNRDCSLSSSIRGRTDPAHAANLLVYYFE